jgi:hypothetical protein
MRRFPLRTKAAMLKAMSSRAHHDPHPDRRSAVGLYAAFYFYPGMIPAGRART